MPYFAGKMPALQIAQKDFIGSQSGGLALKLNITDPQVVEEFKAYFLDVFVTRAYRELDMPLGDLPDGLG